MTQEMIAELVNAFSDGRTDRYVSPVLARLRSAWLEADDNEREIFQKEILKLTRRPDDTWPIGLMHSEGRIPKIQN